MLVVFLIAIIRNHKLVRVNLRLEWDTDYYKSEDFLLNPVCMLFSVHIIVQLYLCKCILAIQIKYVKIKTYALVSVTYNDCYFS